MKDLIYFVQNFGTIQKTAKCIDSFHVFLKLVRYLGETFLLPFLVWNFTEIWKAIRTMLLVLLLKRTKSVRLNAQLKTEEVRQGPVPGVALGPGDIVHCITMEFGDLLLFFL